jgi:hypothetical protein
MTTFQFQVPALGEAPSDELIERLHDDVLCGWEGDDSGMVFYNDHPDGDNKVRTANPGDWVVIDDSGARVSAEKVSDVEVQK